MEESIYIGNYMSNAKLISRFISSLRNFSRIQTKENLLRITVRKNILFDRDIIRLHKLTCVVEDDLFRTVYTNGERVLWKSRLD